eukprot:CAMPEP_0173395702 /NCGR_PEP_ID=MMETSP1356-20130122/33066_1 /TAXON_ID=77927 ORGANISM="Hemiselmis virescens, Strain PCC157" /NCGR_SAMPLE_ID=MMETSP1356 /ASSEMBLY_ACC=CAM_ASM_000847 /LENGTH=177 /DNA_ID=CAMNT_0014354517 /DNA_START=63 /DNA_END=593 /DNA_ORIENTATION=+
MQHSQDLGRDGVLVSDERDGQGDRLGHMLARLGFILRNNVTPLSAFSSSLPVLTNPFAKVCTVIDEQAHSAAIARSFGEGSMPSPPPSFGMSLLIILPFAVIVVVNELSPSTLDSALPVAQRRAPVSHTPLPTDVEDPSEGWPPPARCGRQQRRLLVPISRNCVEARLLAAAMPTIV